MNRSELIHFIRKQKSFLCVGLDPEPEKIPSVLQPDISGIADFLKQIIDATAPFAVAFKPNTAFFEALGAPGWALLFDITAYIREKHPHHFLIADAKRGDIGNTSYKYAKCFLTDMGCDAVTVAPYMGRDSVEPFLKIEGKWAIILGLTSNEGARDFELLTLMNRKMLYEQVLETVAGWGTVQNMMFVAGATRTEYLAGIRKIVPDHFLLVPGVGAQGGNLQEVAEAAMNTDIGLLINASRSVLYASNDLNYVKAAAEVAQRMQEEMRAYIK